MDSDGKTKKQQNKISNDYCSNDRNLFQSTWIRRIIPSHDELDRFLLDYRYYFLLPVGIIFWIVFFITQMG